MMQDLPKCVKQEVQKFIPLSILHEVTCFVFNDRHPLDTQNFDLFVCTTKGEVIELFQREPVSSLSIRNSSKPIHIQLYRNSKNNGYLLVSTNNELFILSKSPKLTYLRRINNLNNYIIEDSTCSGKSCLKVWCSDDLMPVKFDDNLECLNDTISRIDCNEPMASPAFITSMRTNLNQAKYAVSYNTKCYEDVLHLRQRVAFFMNQNIYPNDGNTTVFQDPLKKKNGQLKILNNDALWCKMCNKKIVLALDIYNDSDQTVDDTEVILHGESSVLVYENMIFEAISSPPYWKETDRTIKCNSQVTIAVIINFEDIMKMPAKIEFKGVITYTISGKQCSLPIRRISVSLMELLNESFDILSSSNIATKELLAIISTTYKKEMKLLHVQDKESDSINICDTFEIYLKMQKMSNANMVIHRDSPYHPLNLVMICFDDTKNKSSLGTTYLATVYSRNEKQLILLMKYMYDAMPYKIILLPREIKITSKMSIEQECEDRDFFPEPEHNDKIVKFGQSLMEQMSLILKYYDKCIVKMGDSNNQNVLEMLGEKIDLFIMGKQKFNEFDNKLNEEMLKGIKYLTGKNVVDPVVDDVMIVDNHLEEYPN